MVYETDEAFTNVQMLRFFFCLQKGNLLLSIKIKYKMVLKSIIFLTFFVGLISVRAQETLVFNYDISGNQIKRYFPISLHKDGSLAEEESFVQEQLPSMSKQENATGLVYWPNPVNRNLYMQWENIIGKYLSSIIVSSINGQVLYTRKFDGDVTSFTMDFTNYPSGVYLVMAKYSSEYQQNIRIIKE